MWKSSVNTEYITLSLGYTVPGTIYKGNILKDDQAIKNRIENMQMLQSKNAKTGSDPDQDVSETPAVQPVSESIIPTLNVEDPELKARIEQKWRDYFSS